MKVKESLEELRDICHPTEAHRKDVYRKVSLYTIKPLLSIGFTPNMVTLSRVVFITIAIVLFLTPSYLNWVIGVFLLQLQLFFDTLDGALARYLKLSSQIGEFMDYALDFFVSSILLLLVPGWLLFQKTSDWLSLYLSFASVLLMLYIVAVRPVFTERKVKHRQYKKKLSYRFIHSDNMRFLSFIVFFGVLISAEWIVLILSLALVVLKLLLQKYYLWKLTDFPCIKLREIAVLFFIGINVALYLLQQKKLFGKKYLHSSPLWSSLGIQGRW